MTHLEKIKAEFDLVLAKYKELIADGTLSTSDMLSLLVSGIGSVVRVMDGYIDLPFEQRKQIGLELTQQFYTEIIAPIDIPGVPNIIEGYIDNVAGQLLMVGVEKLYDAIQQMVNVNKMLFKGD